MRHIKAFCNYCGNEVSLPIAEVELVNTDTFEVLFMGLTEYIIHVCPEQTQVPPPLGGREYEGDTE